MTNWRDDEFN